MQLGMIGLGRMGANMTARLVRAGHEVTGFDLDQDAVGHITAIGAGGASSLDELVGSLTAPRAMWMMVPHGPAVDTILEGLIELATPGDAFIDGGNSYYRDTLRRATRATGAGFHFIDVGISGGIWGREQGYSMMIGGEPEPIARLEPVFSALAPAADEGWGRVGPSGSGHFVKMVHNGVEYGPMQAYAEGFSLLAAKQDFKLDLSQVGSIWQHGSVVRSWLLELTTDALRENPEMEGVTPWVPDSGEGRWTVFEAIDLNVSTPVIGLSLLRRIGSREEVEYADRLLSAMRHEFGGHAVKSDSQ